MTKRVLLILIFGSLFNSCAFIFYNYQGYLQAEFAIPNEKNDSAIRYQSGQMLFRLPARSKFYSRYISPNGFDPFLWPGLPNITFSIREEKEITKIKLNYFGYHGFRRNPPHKPA